jgi:UDP-2-acetamido-3-amino-2,3-dideoxy-glucuronate N-acetyltransferase
VTGSAPFIDPRAIVDTPYVGPGTRIWEFVHVLGGARIGRDCNINSHVFIENDVVIGDAVTVKCGVYLWDGVRLEDGVFVGPNVTFTNDARPRSRRPVPPLITTIRQGASLGAAAVVGPGVTIGRYAMVGMGAVVTRDVPDHALVYGNPLRRAGWVCFCGAKMKSRPRTCRHEPFRSAI